MISMGEEQGKLQRVLKEKNNRRSARISVNILKWVNIRGDSGDFEEVLDI
jgi:hypothetical protein